MLVLQVSLTKILWPRLPAEALAEAQGGVREDEDQDVGGGQEEGGGEAPAQQDSNNVKLGRRAPC